MSRWAEAEALGAANRPEIDPLRIGRCTLICCGSCALDDLRPEGFPQSVVLCGVRDVRDLHRRRECDYRGRQRVQHQGAVAAVRGFFARRCSRY